MELSIGKELNQEKFEELVAGTCLEVLSLEELVDIALNSQEMNPGKNKIWEYAGSYYRINRENDLVISIDREQVVGGYNNSEISIVLIKNKIITSKDRTFLRLIVSKIEEKENNVNP